MSLRDDLPDAYYIGVLDDKGEFEANTSCNYDEELAFDQECAYQQERVNRGWYVDATVQLRDYDGNVLNTKYITRTQRAA